GREGAERRRVHDRQRWAEEAVRVEGTGAGRAAAVGVARAGRHRVVVDAVGAGARPEGAVVASRSRTRAKCRRAGDVEERRRAIGNPPGLGDRRVAAAEVEAAEAEVDDLRRAADVGVEKAGERRPGRPGEPGWPAARGADGRREREP